jgi:amino acid transporter
MATPSHTAPEKEGLLASALGLSAVAGQALTHVAPAGGLIISMQFAVQLAGRATPLAFLIAFLIVMTLGVSLTQLSKHISSAGGYYTYASKILGAKTGFFTAWLFFIFDGFQAGMNLAFAGYFIQQILSAFYNIHITWLWPLTLVGGTVAVAILMYRGIRISGRVMVILGGFEVVTFLALAITGFLFSGAGGVSLSAFDASDIPKGGSLFLAVVFSIFAFTGFESAVTLAEETRAPHRTVSRAIILSLLVSGVFYVFVPWGLLSGWGIHDIGAFAATTANPVALMAKRVWGSFFILVVVFYCNSIFGAVLAGNNAATRVYFSMARAGYMPRALGEVNEKRAPMNAITLQAVVTLAFGFFMSLLLGAENQINLWSVMITLAMIVVYIIGNVCVMRLYLTTRRSELNAILHIGFPIVSSVALILVGYKSLVPLPAWPVSLAPWIGLGWLALGVVIVWAIWARARRQGTAPVPVLAAAETPLTATDSED